MRVVTLSLSAHHSLTRTFPTALAGSAAAGAVAVMALERVPSDIRRDGGVARMSPVKKIKEIQQTVSIPVMAKARIGHFVEAQVLEALGVDYVDESEVLTPADEAHHIEELLRSERVRRDLKRDDGEA